MTPFDISWHDGPTVDAATLYELLALRVDVFVVEQCCAYQELDGQDLLPATQHLLMRHQGQIAATLRLLVPDDTHRPVAIGRVVIAPAHRGTGLGHTLMREALARIETVWPGRDAYLSAQAHLQHFYASHGFQAVTDVYLEDDIPHIGMHRPVAHPIP
ncbi:GNAT family N-acetyltransferase [Salinicola aestuarinus]|uniref:GNAT family N-acetyltransferase n=1 Tax=Salinicola aestuarinus TaxID=1949082 RepID=UPI000DA10A14|nr:GNAT family N-acetyltransferase [Salinicola aestuarinus]